MRQSHIAIIGAPLDLGQGRRGVDMGPSAMRVANLNARVASLGYSVEDLGSVPLGLGGDHSVAVGSVSGVSQYLRARNQTAGLIWLDAHADMNTPASSPNGNVRCTPVRGGATCREAHLAMEMICNSGQMVTLQVNRTADLAVEPVMSALGKRIL